MRLLVIALSSLALVLSSSFTMAQKPEWAGKGKGKGKEISEEVVQQQDMNEESESEITGSEFTTIERSRIREHFLSESSSKQVKGQKKARNLPPGLQKKLERGGELPPGWQKKVIIGESFDEELYDQSEDLPEELEQELGNRVGEQYRRIGTKVVKILKGEGTIVDVVDIIDSSSDSESN